MNKLDRISLPFFHFVQKHTKVKTHKRKKLIEFDSSLFLYWCKMCTTLEKKKPEETRSGCNVSRTKYVPNMEKANFFEFRCFFVKTEKETKER